MLRIPADILKKTLVDDGIIKPEAFDPFAQEAGRMGQDIGSILVSRNIITGDYYNNVLAKYYNVPLTALEPEVIHDDILNLLTEEFARSKRVLAFRRQDNGTIDVAMEDPSDLTTIQFLEKKFAGKINPYLASHNDLNRVFSLYGKQQVEGFKKTIQDNINASLKATSGKKDEEAAIEIPIITITDNIISYALSLRASDIHIEALEKEILVRYRVDGILHEAVRIQKEIHPAIVARFKILGGMKLDEHTTPQDGRFRYKLGSENVDIRVSILPTFYGEKVELRLLATGAHIASFEELGMSPDLVKLVAENSSKSYGMMLVTGPTGSGKSTTLYSMLNAVNKPEVNIITVEDPIEYDIKYVNQVQVNELAGITFASALRSILRQDPNIIMVGEIRDPETAEISVHAALTGHLVLSSLHTNDAPTAIPRLMDMKVAPFLISAVVNLAIAQRLVRRICLECLYSYPTPSEVITTITREIKDLKLPEATPVPKTLFRGKGCAACGHTGYRGRLGIFEVMRITEDVRRYIVDPSFTLDGLRDLARAEGMQSMFEDGLLKAGQGLTTIEEIMRVIKE